MSESSGQPMERAACRMPSRSLPMPSAWPSSRPTRLATPATRIDDPFYGFHSKPTGFVDEVAQGLAGEETAAVVEDDVVTALVEVGAVAGGVWREQHARRRPQRVIGW